MKRRDLFGRLAATAAAVALAPSAQAEAAACAECEDIKQHPIPLPEMYVRDPDTEATVLAAAHGVALKQGMSHRAAAMMLAPQFFPSYVIAAAQAEARAEGYERREFIEAMRAESRAVRGLRTGEFHAERIAAPTFEQMQDDCAARGCELELQEVRTYEDGSQWTNIRHLPDGLITQVHLTYAGAGGIDTVHRCVDEWRRSLHA